MFSYINDIEYILFPPSSLFQHFNNKSVIKYLLFSSFSVWLMAGMTEGCYPLSARRGRKQQRSTKPGCTFIYPFLFELRSSLNVLSLFIFVYAQPSSLPHTHTQYTFYDSFMRKDIRSICKVLKCRNGKFTTLLLID